MLRNLRPLGAPMLALGLIAAAAAQTPATSTATTALNEPLPYAIELARDTDPRVSPSLTISGEWPTPCTPTYETANLTGVDLRVDARAALSLCDRRATPFTIEVNAALALDRASLAAGVFHVSFYAANGAQAEPKLRAFALVDTNATAPAFAPENGFWWTTSGTRSGASRNVISLERQGSQLTAALMSYDRDGRGNWQFGTAPIKGRVAHVPLLQLAGSDPFSAASTAPHGEAGLMLDLEFHTNSLATAWLSRKGDGEDAPLQLQTMDLVRLPFADTGDGSAWKGDWVLVTDADAVAPLRLRLDQVAALDPLHFRLSDTAAGIALDCGLDAQNTELPPPRCVVHQADGIELGSFYAVAITRMDGARSDGSAMHLLRISP